MRTVRKFYTQLSPEHLGTSVAEKLWGKFKPTNHGPRGKITSEYSHTAYAVDEIGYNKNAKRDRSLYVRVPRGKFRNFLYQFHSSMSTVRTSQCPGTSEWLIF